MCGITGWVNNKKQILHNSETFKKMLETLNSRGPDETGYYYSDNAILGHKRLSIIDLENGQQPMNYNNYKIIYNGELYNTKELRDDLINKGYNFNTTCDTEVLLIGYVHYKEKILDLLDGIFSFAVYDGISLFIARDRLGVKPLFYTKVNNNFLFASEIKTLLKNDIVKPIINKESLKQLLALGPSRVPGSGIFKNIYELKPGHYGIYKKNKLKIKQYWKLKNKIVKETFKDSIKRTRTLVEEAIKKQMVSDIPISTMLSGGIDSSIITSICANELSKIKKNINTYSVEYAENEKNFVKNDYQTTTDNYYIDLVKEKYNTNHKTVVLSEEDLAEYLEEALIARDYPSMVDIDSSLLCFSNSIKERVVLSGECADEIFGGYPWFYKKELLNKKGFPWINLNSKENILNKRIKNKLKINKYMLSQYKKTIKELKYKTTSHQKMMYLNIKWFMANLLERTDRMTMRSSIETRVPFADHYLIEYLWNVPWKYKFYNNKEKALLRLAFKDLLPEQILNRKKNPYPKVHSVKYNKLVNKLLLKRLDRKNSELIKIFDKNKILSLISNEKTNNIPWYGQLMNKTQLIAYLYQFDLWLEKYKIILDI